MTVNPELVGRRFRLPEPYLVGREHVREFARAVLATSPVHFDVEAARAAGYADVVAPATYSAVLQDRAMQLLLADELVDFELKQIVHGDERFTFARQIVAGDELTAELEVTGVRALGANSMISAATTVADAEGATVVTGTATLVVGGSAE
ncbi:MAG: MaoC family dehydratase [Microbacteriaceae bacterium]|nr:MaoC family dehydratase [Microbacteriaceae bacterium]